MAEKASLLVGAGSEGVNWAKDRPGIVTVDRDEGLIGESPPLHVVGDTMNLPFPDGSVPSIAADFLLNPVCIESPQLSEVSDSPERLLEPTVPPKVRSWYQSLERPFDIQKGDLGTVRELCRETAVDEMWRVLQPAGTLVLLDRKHVNDWTIQQTSSLDPPPPLRDVQVMHITEHDEKRSDSLRRIRTVDGMKGPVSKIRIRKPE
ncbi:hypothetical protein ACFL2C_04320 [Patescibacteria group bacterium]